jgi:hypothetical protein
MYTAVLATTVCLILSTLLPCYVQALPMAGIQDLHADEVSAHAEEPP